MREWVLAETNYAAVKARRWEVAVLPLGATEPHNLHMPYGTDNFQCDAVGEAVCGHAFARGAAVFCLPTLPFGVNTNYFGIPGGMACSLNPATLAAVITDLVDSMERFGIRKMVVLNGHGGNEIKPVLRSLHHRSRVHVFGADWYRVGRDKYADIFKSPGEHADEMETSMGLAYFPSLVKPGQADAGTERPCRFEAVRRGWVQMTRPWHLATTNTGLGDPSAATAEKGRRLMDVVVERIGAFLVDLAAADVDEKFPY